MAQNNLKLLIFSIRKHCRCVSPSHKQRDEGHQTPEMLRSPGRDRGPPRPAQARSSLAFFPEEAPITNSPGGKSQGRSHQPLVYLLQHLASGRGQRRGLRRARGCGTEIICPAPRRPSSSASPRNESILINSNSGEPPSPIRHRAARLHFPPGRSLRRELSTKSSLSLSFRHLLPRGPRVSPSRTPRRDGPRPQPHGGLSRWLLFSQAF